MPVRKVHKTNLENLHTESITVGSIVGAVAPCETKGNFAIACKEGFAMWGNNELEIRDPFLSNPDYRMNNAKCDTRGRFWDGSCRMDFEPGRGKFQRFCSQGIPPPFSAGDGID